MCSRFPRNHCIRWCPLNVSLVPLRPIQTTVALPPSAAPDARVGCDGSRAQQQTETPRAGDVDTAGSPASAQGACDLWAGGMQLTSSRRAHAMTHVHVCLCCFPQSR